MLQIIVALQQQQPAWATRLLAAADQKRRSQGVYFTLGLQGVGYEQALKNARLALGEKGFVRIWKEGHDLSPLEALAARDLIVIPISPPPPLPIGKR